MEIWVQMIALVFSTFFAIIGFLTYRLISDLDKRIAEVKSQLGPVGKDLKELSKELHGICKELEFMWRVIEKKQYEKPSSSN